MKRFSIFLSVLLLVPSFLAATLAITPVQAAGFNVTLNYNKDGKIFQVQRTSPIPNLSIEYFNPGAPDGGKIALNKATSIYAGTCVIAYHDGGFNPGYNYIAPAGQDILAAGQTYPDGNNPALPPLGSIGPCADPTPIPTSTPTPTVKPTPVSTPTATPTPVPMSTPVPMPEPVPLPCERGNTCNPAHLMPPVVNRLYVANWATGDVPSKLNINASSVQSNPIFFNFYLDGSTAPMQYQPGNVDFPYGGDIMTLDRFKDLEVGNHTLGVVAFSYFSLNDRSKVTSPELTAKFAVTATPEKVPVCTQADATRAGWSAADFAASQGLVTVCGYVKDQSHATVTDGTVSEASYSQASAAQGLTGDKARVVAKGGAISSGGWFFVALAHTVFPNSSDSVRPINVSVVSPLHGASSFTVTKNSTNIAVILSPYQCGTWGLHLTDASGYGRIDDTVPASAILVTMYYRTQNNYLATAQVSLPDPSNPSACASMPDAYPTGLQIPFQVAHGRGSFDKDVYFYSIDNAISSIPQKGTVGWLNGSVLDSAGSTITVQGRVVDASTGKPFPASAWPAACGYTACTPIKIVQDATTDPATPGTPVTTFKREDGTFTLSYSLGNLTPSAGAGQRQLFRIVVASPLGAPGKVFPVGSENFAAVGSVGYVAGETIGDLPIASMPVIPATLQTLKGHVLTSAGTELTGVQGKPFIIVKSYDQTVSVSTGYVPGRGTDAGAFSVQVPVGKNYQVIVSTPGFADVRFPPGSGGDRDVLSYFKPVVITNYVSNLPGIDNVNDVGTLKVSAR